eukprot:CAMPEP_0201592182 /NCGR_PEP_ID=MMETSP0190_2-20130828/190142_1 /ASSEMBLY_ACC=CAM_ASM_000263 /TAXON_ID=37353 /ORGANISM="Rosalina sp." /LENGTH=310 /DNA_ID=CAMNT_0048050821 /DNA_START=1131 /DNA_END=2064 /DNA_ORIENTATION=-
MDWTIEDTVDEEEHNLKPCNPVDLEKRLRKQKTSKEGQAETITITDQQKIAEIQEWKQARAMGQPLQKIRSQKTLPLKDSNQGSDDDAKTPSASATSSAPPSSKSPAPPTRAPPTRASISGKPPPKPTKPPSKPPPRRSTLNSHRRQASGPPRTPKKTTSIDAPSMSTANSGPPKGPPKKPPSSKVPSFAPPKKSQSANKPPPFAPSMAIKEDKVTTNTPKPSSAVPKPSAATNKRKPGHKKNDSRMSMLASIQNFKGNKLKHVDAETLKKEAAAKPSTVNNLLQATLKNYRQFVMDDDDSDDSDGGWDD